MITSHEGELSALQITMKKLAHGTALLLTGLASATVAWGFWYVTGASSFQILSAVTIAVLALENRRLRKRLEQLRTELKS